MGEKESPPVVEEVPPGPPLRGNGHGEGGFERGPGPGLRAARGMPALSELAVRMRSPDAFDNYFNSPGMDGIFRKTDLTPWQVVAWARARWFARTFKVPQLENLVNLLAENRISVNRRGRIEAVQALGARAASTRIVERRGGEP